MENNFIAALIVHCLKKPRNISFELVIDKSFFPEYVREVYPLLGEDQKKGFEVTLDA